jgi:beta-glucanase (GH16 family)
MFKASHARVFRGASCAGLLMVLLASCGGGAAGGGIGGSSGSSGSSVSIPSVGSPTPSPSPSPVPTTASASWTECGGEGSVCTFTGTKNVRFGANSTYAYQTATGSIRCSVNDFADPLPGVSKSCAYTDSTDTAATPSPTPTPTPTPTPSTANGPFGQDASQYTLTFSDEFNSTFNTSVWNDTIWYEASNPTKNYAVEDGVLKIWPQRDASGNFFNRTIDTDGKYYQTYGYFEIEAKLGVGKGTWPAFWLFNHIGNRRPEIDVMEAYAGGGPNSGWSDSNFHPTAYAATVWSDGGVLAGTKTLQTTDLSAGFHKYAVKWEPGKQTFYFDGQPFYVLNVSMGDPMYLMLDLWYGSASGTPDNSTPTGKSNSYEVNYIRAWQFK